MQFCKYNIENNNSLFLKIMKTKYGFCPTLHRLVVCSLKVPLQHISYIDPLFIPLISGITAIFYNLAIRFLPNPSFKLRVI